jgi:hypothetical protein
VWSIARVNRLHPGKDHGLIIDYYGVVTELHDALELYSALEEKFDEEDLEVADQGPCVTLKSFRRNLLRDSLTDMETSQPTRAAIGFLGFREFDDGDTYRGAILVTDEWSKPLEFRCTAPVRPTQLQRTLYGKSLLPHVLTELIGEPLISSVREEPQLILIADEAYFDVRHKISAPVIRVNRPVIRVDHPDNSKNTKKEQPPSKSLLLQSASGKFAQVEVEAHWKFADDLELSGERLRDLFGRWDLIEPFKRLAEGLQYVHDERVLES